MRYDEGGLVGICVGGVSSSGRMSGCGYLVGTLWTIGGCNGDRANKTKV